MPQGVLVPPKTASLRTLSLASRSKQAKAGLPKAIGNLGCSYARSSEFPVGAQPLRRRQQDAIGPAPLLLAPKAGNSLAAIPWLSSRKSKFQALK